jgi:plasmid stabilization system protein ParE
MSGDRPVSPGGAASTELGKDVRMIVFGDYLILYRHSRSRVVIERVLHGARDIQSLF